MKKSKWNNFSIFTAIFFIFLLVTGATVWTNSNSIDKSTHATIGVDYGHHEIHDGSSFTAYGNVATAATDGHRTAIYTLTPSAKEIHMIVSFGASTAAKFDICEGVTVDTNEGTNAVATYNRNRNSASVSELKDNATTPAAGKVTIFNETQLANANLNTGTILRSGALQAGAGPKPAGGTTRDTAEYILKKGTKYLFMITNTAASANNHDIELDWYEHTYKGEPYH